jgi:hypothetical protein
MCLMLLAILLVGSVRPEQLHARSPLKWDKKVLVKNRPSTRTNIIILLQSKVVYLSNISWHLRNFQRIPALKIGGKHDNSVCICRKRSCCTLARDSMFYGSQCGVIQILLTIIFFVLIRFSDQNNDIYADYKSPLESLLLLCQNLKSFLIDSLLNKRFPNRIYQCIHHVWQR